MPIYEFRCEACKAIFELLAMRQGDEMEAQCPHCGGKEMSRVISTCASVVADSPSSSGTGQTGLQNRSCGKGDSCSTLTLSGHTR